MKLPGITSSYVKRLDPREIYFCNDDVDHERYWGVQAYLEMFGSSFPPSILMRKRHPSDCNLWNTESSEWEVALCMMGYAILTHPLLVSHHIFHKSYFLLFMRRYITWERIVIYVMIMMSFQHKLICKS